MKTFSCTCGQLIFFQNVFCVACKKELAFLPEFGTLSTLEPASNGLFTAASSDGNRLYKKCQNYDRESVCNWMIPEDEPEVFCQSCRLNELIPDLSLEGDGTLSGSHGTGEAASTLQPAQPSPAYQQQNSRPGKRVWRSALSPTW